MGRRDSRRTSRGGWLVLVLAAAGSAFGVTRDVTTTVVVLAVATALAVVASVLPARR